uniref:protein-tyrosine-phosphatase n=1 Tax=Caenorhabditis japonica TaxID=281687 RepID=A0A8R1DPC7_CAEJA
MFLLIFLLASYNSIASSSSILVDFSSYALQPAPQAYLIEYTPPVGYPPTGSAVEGTTFQSFINGTISATEYTVSVSAILMDGSRKNVAEFPVFSSPDAPTLDSVETTEHEATISYFPPQGQNITYRIEYYPEEHKEYSNAIDTKASLVRLRGLDSGTTFRLKIRSAYQGVISQELIDTTFITQGTSNYDYSSSAEAYSVRTLPPNFNLGLQTTTEMTSYEYSKEVEEDTTITTPLVAVTTTMAPTTTTISVKSSTTETERETETETVPTTTTTITLPPETTASTTTTTTTKKTTTTTHQKLNPVEVNSGDLGADHPTENSNALIDISQMIQEYGEPSGVALSDENEMLRLDWEAPENANCEAFFVNYTILSLNRPRSFSLATSDEHADIKMFPEHTLDIRVFCMLAGALSKTWWAHRIAHLSKPKQLENVRVTEVNTDDFYVASMKLTWDWPVYHDFENYKIMISYGMGKEGTREMEVTSKEDMVILDKLEPSSLYHISVRNASTELSLSSKITQLDQVTAPIISSTVYPGQISSNSININFGDSDPEQGKFDYYLLTFSGNNKNISKKVEMEHEKSFTFTKLIPGKTYQFAVYTVYKGVKSRPVSADITTYPLKVNQLFPVVGKDYVVLYWDIENFADSDCRFRLSYNADNIPTVSVELKGASRHRFSGLQSEVYYTFTIIVIMGVGKAAAESESEMITVAIPKGRLSPSVHRQGSRELVVGFDNDLQVFSLLNGSPDNFAVIVSDDTSLNDDNYELKSWFEVKEEEVWGAYRASPSTWNPFDSERVRRAAFTVGTDDCVKRNLDEPYCNGILRAGTEYRVKIRMYTDTKVAMETDWGRIEGAKNSDGDEEEEEEEEDERRFPCHMYLNGCRRKSANHPRFSPILIAISVLFSAIFLF